MTRRTLSLALLCSCILIFCGCSTYSESERSNTLEAQPTFKFTDIPVPIGLKPMPESSYSFQCSGVRVGVLRYKGKGDAEQIISFYKQQMPMYNWTLVNVIEYGQRLLNFERETESCIITMQPKGSNITLTISVGPKSQNLTKRDRTQKTLDK